MTRMVRDYVRFLPRDIEFNHFLTEFQGESERAAAVLGAAYLDDLLRQLLESFFVEDARAANELLSDLNALGMYSARSRLSYALGLISSDERDDLAQIGAIRNKFAHRKDDLSFDKPPISDHCANFALIRERFTAEPQLADAYPQDQRSLYNLEVALLAYYLTRRLAHVRRVQLPDPALWPRYDLPGERR
jgi:DNA-binding MltR family transcriptional regulator